MKKQIHYKAIFTSNGQKEVIEMEAPGYFYNDPYRILFNYQQTHIEMIVDHKNIILKNNDAVLNLNTDEDVFNNYKLSYGYTHFKSKVEMLENTKNHLYIKYVLFDDISELTQAYIKVTLKDEVLPA